MRQQVQAVLEPRKTPVQTRSVVSVDAILKATVQVLLRVGKERLTTTRVAMRAGVSVGTLYQYFPNKSALLKAVLKAHMELVAGNVEQACREHRGQPLEQMAAALVMAFLEAKMRDTKISVALYSVSSDVDGAKVVQEMSVRMNAAAVEMLKSSPERLAGDVAVIASVLLAAMAGVSRRLLESKEPEKELEGLRKELVVLVRAYVRARTPDRG